MALYDNSPNNNRPAAGQPLDILIRIAMAIGAILFIFILLRGLVRLLYFIAPILLIVTALIRRQVLIDYVVNLGAIFRRDPLRGVIWAVAGVFFYPFLFLWLFLKAMFFNKVETLHNSAQLNLKRQNGKPADNNGFADYEELDSKPLWNERRGGKTEKEDNN